MPEIDSDHIDYLIEIRGVYDGWSIAVMDDGEWINRWANGEWRGSRRDYETQKYIEANQPGSATLEE